MRPMQQRYADGAAFVLQNFVEVWTRIVNAPGNIQGASCEEVAIAKNKENRGGAMEVQCDGK